MLRYLDLLFCLLLVIVLSRLLSMMMIPVFDTTEARYGEIARIMAETGDWITPWFSQGVPFWGKPPLSFWTEAISFRIFGVTEFAARLPSWLANLITLGLIYHLTRTIGGQRHALVAVLVYSTMALSYAMSGAVLTDPFLTLGTTLAFVSIILSSRQPSSHWGWWFFVSLSIGLLAKGPLALVLIGGPLILWVMWRRQWRDLNHLPWGRGLLLMTLLSLPWYIAAELKTPGFIHYFIIGEHFLRFVDSGWSGDLYGSAHSQPYGTIWLYWLGASFPWGIIFVVALIWRYIRARKRNQPFDQKLSDVQRLLLLLALFPSLFFTFAGNILLTYQLPALAPLSILIAMLLTSAIRNNKFGKSGAIITILFVPFIATLASFYIFFYPDKLATEKTLLTYYNEHRNHETQPLIYVGEPPFSARFYSRGMVKSMELPEVKALIKKNAKSTYFIAIANKNMDIIADSLASKVEIKLTNQRYTLLQIDGANQSEKE